MEIVLFGEDLSTFQVPFEHLAVGVVTDPNRLAELYSSSTVFFDGSNFHGAGRPVLEAMACGTPTVVTDVGGIHEFARDGWNLDLVAPGDPEAAAAAIARLLENPDRAEELRQGGFRTVERLDMRRQAVRLHDYFLSVTSGERTGVGAGG